MTGGEFLHVAYVVICTHPRVVDGINIVAELFRFVTKAVPDGLDQDMNAQSAFSCIRPPAV